VSSTRRQVAQGLAVAGLAASALPAWAQTSPAPPPVAKPPQPADDEPQVEGGDAPSKVAADRDTALRLVVPVMVNGQGPFNFIVDTGANRSCMSQALAAKLQLDSAGAIPVHTVVGVRNRASVRVDRLQIGEKTQRRVQVPVLPITGVEADGVLGVDWLKNRRLVLDFKGKSLEITAPRAEAPAEDRVIVPARRRSGQLTLVDADVGGKPISALIDSGSQLSIGNSALRHILPSLGVEERNRVQQVELASLIGETFTGEMLYVPFLRLGGLTLGNVPVVFADTHVFQLWKLSTTPSLILGMDLLTQFTAVALDFGRSTVRFDFVNKPGAKQL
jgi:predicted aspartyl protease